MTQEFDRIIFRQDGGRLAMACNDYQVDQVVSAITATGVTLIQLSNTQLAGYNRVLWFK